MAGWKNWLARSVARKVGASAAALAALFMAPPAWAERVSILWEIAHNRCLSVEASANECEFVDRMRKYVILKDRVGKIQYLLIPTDRIAGIESPEILAPDAPNYWQEAWAARRFLEQRANRAVPWNDVALAINSASGRSQNQLHIHIDCIRADVKEALGRSEGQIGAGWKRLEIPLLGHFYLAMRVEGEELGDLNPFKILADGVPSAAAHMGDQTLVVVGASFGDGKKGFYVLNDHVDMEKGDFAHGEELLDHTCAVLTE